MVTTVQMALMCNLITEPHQTTQFEIIGVLILTSIHTRDKQELGITTQTLIHHPKPIIVNLRITITHIEIQTTIIIEDNDNPKRSSFELLFFMKNSFELNSEHKCF